MLEAKIYLFFFITLIFLTIKINSLDNSTVDESNNDDDDDISELEFEEFKNTVQRYRRLIPYMSSFVANNYVNNQGQNYERDEQLPQPEMLKQTRRLIKPRPVNNYRVSQQQQVQQQQRPTTLIKTDRFVPSIQYDPKDIGNDNDYFRPVQYTSKINNYDDYYHEYDRRQNYPDITTQNIQDSRYFSKEQTQRGQVSQNPPIYEHEYSKQKLINPQTEYLIDYIPRLTKQHQQQTQDYYQVEGYEPIRYVKIEPPRSLSYSHPQRLIPQHQFNHHHHHHQVQQQQQRNPIIQNDNILKSLQLTNRLPEMLNRDNIDSSIKTLVEILGLLHGKKTEQQKIQLADFNLPINNIKNDNFNKKYIRPKVVTESRYQATSKPLLQSTIDDTDDDVNFKSVTYKNNDKSKIPYSSYKSQTQNPSVIEYYTPTIQDISDNEQLVYDNYDNHHDNIEDEQQKQQLIINNNVKLTNNHDIIDEEEFVSEKKPVLPNKHINIDEKVVGNPLVIPTMAIKYGATRGKPFVDYPAYSSIPKTNFECKKQRYKGFFGDPESECQAWHYCDLNGGKSSFLCPNGTIFSQAALTCDWWFNVKCESTTQLYVLNERLYKFILPIMPKFPEDFTGPEADKYIELKFKEMEEKMKEKKLKKAMEKKTKEKIQSNNNSTM